ncbi:DMT family transporter [Pinisolibacter aquiterrae]|uniref:DMT family transporter n=1 Tax=Pinisolibacter aquiterrae TaxID=2815579 RepID=UPI001C3D94C3|nr:EamA family transporter [Pinisolibacter aquiterrae]MBV5265917.1 EamA family transporter [Pinisolibacter aquiterrae]MCC8237225.1 DMT family transporter [Pinisolibacter aquiterrae]
MNEIEVRMNRFRLLAAAATILWGFTYVISSTMLPHTPWFIGAVRAGLGAIPLLLIAREFPPAGYGPKLVVLGTLNTGLFFGLLFIGALRLPGGVAGIFQALGPLFSVLLVWPLLNHRPTTLKISSLLVGLLGVILVVAKGDTALDGVGVLAALGSAFSVALGGVLVQRWGNPMTLTGFTAWQLVIATVELGLATLVLGDAPVTMTSVNLLGLAIVALVLTSLPFFLWFKAIHGAGAANVAPFFLLTPIVAFALDALVRGIVPNMQQSLGMALVIGGLVMNIAAARRTTQEAKVQEVELPEQAVVD